MLKQSKRRRSDETRLPTSIDIARAAGVSQATVSRVLNGGSASDGTRRRIFELADELGYSLNGVARGLAMRRTGLVGVVVADIRNPFYPELLECIGTGLARRGRQMLVHDANVGAEEDAAKLLLQQRVDRATKLLLQQRVDGILFMVSLTNSETIASLVRRGFPVVLSNRVTDMSCDAIEGDNWSGARDVADLLVELGHRRIAMLKGHPRATTTKQRTQGFKSRLGELGVPLPERFDIFSDFSYEQAYIATRSLLALRWPPTAIFCQNDLMGFAALNAARGCGLTVPGDLSVVGFDDVPQASWESLNLTSVRQPLAEMAGRSVEMLEERLTDPALPPRHERFSSVLVVRGTTERPPSSRVKRAR